jgi:DNA-directed RNA polymerase subunit RPC12/RpoP
MIQFKCPECGRSIEVPEEKSSKRVECPSCLETVLVPRVLRSLVQTAGDDGATGNGLLPWLGDGVRPTGVPFGSEGDSAW